MEKEWMVKLAKKAEAIRLIQGTLGCGCPKEVFEHYLVQLISLDQIPVVQLILGNRLLVWVVDGMNMEDVEKQVPLLLKKGCFERDRQKLNRFRLVLVGRISQSRCSNLLQRTESLDTKVHLHSLSPLFWDGLTERIQGR